MTEAMSNVERVKFMDERVRFIDAQKTLGAMPLDGNPRIILHLFPSKQLEGVDVAVALGLLGLTGASIDSPRLGDLLPITSGSFTKISLDDDGLLVYTGYDYDTIRGDGGFNFVGRQPTVNSYLRVYNKGIIEAVQASYYKNDKLLLHRKYEKDILVALPRYLNIQQQLGVELPVTIRLTATGMRGCFIGNDNSEAVSGKITTSQLRLPEVSVNTFTPGDRAEIAEILKEPFYNVWQAGGIARSMNYNEDGRWSGY